MRHDKAAFAADAMAAAATGKLIGDHERVLLFSAYARLLDPSLTAIKEELAPFTGSFVSDIPVTTTYLRLALTTLGWAADGRIDDAERLFADGVRRLDEARRFTGSDGGFATAIEADRKGWDDVYDALDLLELGLRDGESWAAGARDAAVRVFDGARLRGGP
jgi:hypothetical protein